MAATNTIAHRRLFEGLVKTADADTNEGDDVALAILYAALATASKRLGQDRCSVAVRDYLAHNAD